MIRLPDAFYRSLAVLCRKQAAFASTEGARRELERMALEYGQLAEKLERNPEQNLPAAR